jgi:hypothetical protein
MKNVKHYSQMLVSVMMIVLAGYAGVAVAQTVTSSPSASPCWANDLSGNMIGWVRNGCCSDATNGHDGYVWACTDGHNNCVYTLYPNGSWTIECR